MQTVTTTAEQTTTIEVAPELVARLSSVLAYYQELKLERDLLDEAIDIEKAKVFAALTENGIEKLSVDNIPLAIVGGYSSRLDKVKFVELGGSLAQLDNATVKKAKKKYLRIGAEKETAE